MDQNSAYIETAGFVSFPSITPLAANTSQIYMIVKLTILLVHFFFELVIKVFLTRES